MKSMVTSRPSWKGRSATERRQSLDSMFVLHRNVRQVVDWIERELDARAADRRGNGALLIAPSGAGKTALAKYLGALHPDVVTPELTTRPVVSMSVPSSASPSSLGGALLAALGDPLPNTRPSEKRQERALKLIKACRTQLITIDNFHDIPARRREIGVQAAGNWVRDLIEQAGPTLVLAMGMREAEIVRDSNGQLGRRMQARLELPHFDISERGGLREWCELLRMVDAQLPLAGESRLYEPRLAARLALATNGILDYLMQLLKNAIQRAVERGNECLEMDDLRIAFTDTHQTAATGTNPFAANYDGRPLNEPGQPFYRTEIPLEFMRRRIKS